MRNLKPYLAKIKPTIYYWPVFIQAKAPTTMQATERFPNISTI